MAPLTSPFVTYDRRGMLLGTGAYLWWGFIPLFFRLLEPSDATEILAHRVLWALGFVALLLALQRRTGWFTAIVARPRALGALALASAFLSVNWLTFIWAVNHEHVVEVSLGYFINPLVSVALGILVLREQLRGPQWAAMGIATIAVVMLTLDYGRLPWVAMTLAFSFGFYGLLKRLTAVGAMEGLAVETALMLLPAVAWLAYLETAGTATFGRAGAGHTALLVASGAVTAVPLLLFAGAARRLPLTMIGLLQYLAPTLQFLLGVFVFHEPLPAGRLAGFALVWVALIVFTVDGVTHHRRQLRLVTEPVG